MSEYRTTPHIDCVLFRVLCNALGDRLLLSCKLLLTNIGYIIVWCEVRTYIVSDFKYLPCENRVFWPHTDQYFYCTEPQCDTKT